MNHIISLNIHSFITSPAAFSFHNADMTAMERVDDEDDDEYLECPKPDEIDMIIQELAYKNERYI